MQKQKLLNKAKAVMLYAHPKSVVVMTSVAVWCLFFFIVLWDIRLYLLSLLAALYVFVKYKMQKENRVFYVTKTSILSPKVQCIEQRTKFINKENICPRQLFFEELNNLIANLEPGVVYVAATHQKVIDAIKNTEDVKAGLVTVEIKEYSYERNLTKIEKEIANKTCKTCEKETCRTHLALHNAPVRKETLYAIELKRL